MVSTSLPLETSQHSRLIGLGYDAALDRSAWRVFANTAAEAFDCQLAIIELWDDAAPERSFLVTGGLGHDFEVLMTAARQTRAKDNYWRSLQDQPAGTVKLGSDVVLPEAMHETEAYRQIAVPWQLEHFLFGSIVAGNGVTAVMSLGRMAHAKPFLPGDKNIIGRMLLSHLRRSLGLQREIEGMRSTNRLLLAAMDHAPWGLLVFDSRGKPMVINKAASAIFSKGDGLTLVKGILCAKDPVTHAQLEWAMAAALETASGRIVAPPPPVLIARHLRPYTYRAVFSPISLRTDRDDFPAGSAVVLMLHEDRPAPTKGIPAALRSTYGLSRAELRLCEALLAGHDLPEAALALNVSRNTAKTHLARIFDKTGVRTQMALLRLLVLGTRD